MFVDFVFFPPIKDGKDAEFREWFAWSNEGFAKSEGFISRTLLIPLEGGNYASVFEFQSQEAFKAMQASPFHAEANKRGVPLFDGFPDHHFYELIE